MQTISKKNIFIIAIGGPISVGKTCFVNSLINYINSNELGKKITVKLFDFNELPSLNNIQTIQDNDQRFNNNEYNKKIQSILQYINNTQTSNIINNILEVIFIVNSCAFINDELNKFYNYKLFLTADIDTIYSRYVQTQVNLLTRIKNPENPKSSENQENQLKFIIDINKTYENFIKPFNEIIIKNQLRDCNGIIIPLEIQNSINVNVEMLYGCISQVLLKD